MLRYQVAIKLALINVIQSSRLFTEYAFVIDFVCHLVVNSERVICPTYCWKGCIYRFVSFGYNWRGPTYYLLCIQGFIFTWYYRSYAFISPDCFIIVGYFHRSISINTSYI